MAMDEKVMKLIEKLGNCQAKCNYCFNACLEEDDVKMMVKCIKLDKECAEICALTLFSVASKSSLYKEVVQLCAKACEECAEECRKYPDQHCQECAKACQECANACKNFV